ncbi:MAG: VanZ family protein [Candidatus Aminicenantales bacterium]
MKKLTYFLPAILFYLLIFLLSSQDLDIDFKINHLDKVIHIFEFGLLGFLLAIGFFNALSFASWTKSVLTFGSGLLLSVADEVHQLFVPRRRSGFKDIVADAAGLVFGILVFRYLVARRKPARKKPR